MSAPESTAQSLREALGEPDDTRGTRGMDGRLRRRFMIAYFAIAVIAGVAIGSFVILLAEPDPAPSPNWSSFKPTGSDSARIKQIADRVGRPYRLEDGSQLAVALGGPPTVGEVPVKIVAIRPDTSQGLHEEDDVETVSGADTVQYTLCGLGSSCAISEGTATTARGALLVREAIELALYTFKYVDSAGAVTVILPPQLKGKKVSSPAVLFLQRGDVSAELKHPLAASFASKTPPIGGMPAAEQKLVSRIAIPNLYSHEYQLAQDGSAVLVLTPRSSTSTGT